MSIRFGFAQDNWRDANQGRKLNAGLWDGRGLSTLHWEIIPAWGWEGIRGNPYQVTFAYQRALPAGLALPSNKVISLKAKRLSSEAKFCCSSHFSCVAK